MFFELIVNYERARIFFCVKINFFNFMALNEVIRENHCTRLKSHMKGM
jgi:hypothetical protein